ncbi:MAG: phosphatase PAP2 family protein [Propionibacteriales bacterium]|nr:phosphatase PAP2 family protein [Propionibacteriales bacterium]
MLYRQAEHHGERTRATDVGPSGAGAVPRWAWWNLAVTGGFLVAVSAEVAANSGLWVWLDQVVHNAVVAGEWRKHAVVPMALDHIGQREPIAGLLLGIATTLSLYRRTPRPLVVSLLPLIAVNLVVGAVKIGFGRGDPSTDETASFVGGMLYPSGHTANVVLTWGLMAYLLFVYGRVRWRKSDAVAVVAGLSLVMGVVSVYRDTHWVTDIVAGWMIGAFLLQATVIADSIAMRRRRLPPLWSDRPRRTGAVVLRPGSDHVADALHAATRVVSADQG